MSRNDVQEKVKSARLLLMKKRELAILTPLQQCCEEKYVQIFEQMRPHLLELAKAQQTVMDVIGPAMDALQPALRCADAIWPTLASCLEAVTQARRGLLDRQTIDSTVFLSHRRPVEYVQINVYVKKMEIVCPQNIKGETGSVPEPNCIELDPYICLSSDRNHVYYFQREKWHQRRISPQSKKILRYLYDMRTHLHEKAQTLKQLAEKFSKTTSDTAIWKAIKRLNDICDDLGITQLIVSYSESRWRLNPTLGCCDGLA